MPLGTSLRMDTFRDFLCRVLAASNISRQRPLFGKEILYSFFAQDLVLDQSALTIE